MMKHLYIKRVFGGLGLVDHIIGGHIGEDGTLEVVMADMDTMVADTVVEDIGLAVVLGAVVEEVEIVEGLVEAVAVDLVVVEEADLVVEEAVEDAVEAVAEEVVKFFY
jgi:hypothetical protein